MTWPKRLLPATSGALAVASASAMLLLLAACSSSRSECVEEDTFGNCTHYEDVPADDDDPTPRGRPPECDPDNPYNMVPC